MAKSTGFLQLRRGLWEHVRDGRMTATETVAFIYICSEADTRTGIWSGSAKSLSGELGISERTARDVLERMERGKYIRRFPIPGRHSCYPILIHKFLITDGEHNGEQLDAISSINTGALRYLPTKTREHDGEHNGEHGAAQRKKRIETEKKTLAAKTTPSADPRFQPFLDFAFGAFKAKHGQKPTWTEKDFNGLKRLLAANKGLDDAELQRRFRNYLGSTEPFTQKQGDALAYFCSHVDSFLTGPILERSKSNGNYPGKTSNVETTLDGYRQLQQARAN